MVHLSLPSCQQCGYDLSGLGRRGRCPECGQAFDRVTGAGLVEPPSRRTERYDRGDRLMRRLRTLGLLVPSVVLLICGGIGVLLVDEWQYVMGSAAVLAAVLGLGAWASYVTERDEP
jgi:hypothetical protein